LALATIGRKAIEGKPIDRKWKLKMLLAKHSPLRGLQFIVTMKIPYWVSVHLVRHNIGILHYVSTQRDDRTNDDVPRAEKPQGAIVNHVALVNAQAILEISDQRLCFEASTETQLSWATVKTEIAKIEPEMAKLMTPPCVKQGVCAEWNDCGYMDRPKGKRERKEFLETIKETRS
jgi:hypothetical protein